MNWFEVKVTYYKLGEDDLQKQVTELYVVDALSFTEAEGRITEEMSSYISGEFNVADIKRAKYAELFFSDDTAADKWFKCKMAFITEDPKTGKEKRSASTVLVQAADLRDAVLKLDEGMKSTMIDYVIVSVSETAILDVYRYQVKESE